MRFLKHSLTTTYGRFEDALLHVQVHFQSRLPFPGGRDCQRALSKAPKLLKKFIDLNPAILQNQQVVDVIARYKRNKSF